MAPKWEYDFVVRWLIAASVAAFGILILAPSSAYGQIHGTPTSVTSIGFGGNFDRAPGTPASVTSLGPNGYSGQTQKQFNCCINPLAPTNPQAFRLHHHRHSPFPLGGAVYAVPYTPVYILDPGIDDSMEDPIAPAPQPAYPSGPTIFDRRASGQSSQSVEAAYAERAHEAPAADLQRSSAPQPAAPVAIQPAAQGPPENQPQTVLVFKDGHQLEVQNYAIVGDTLYDMTPGHRSRVALSALDLGATVKENDDRGIDFQLPATPQTN